MAVATEYTKVAQELYLSYFGRPADAKGLASMTEALAAAKAPTDTAGLSVAYKTNTAVKALMDSFGTSAESAALYPGSTADFVKAVYANLFGRAPDAEGAAYWIGQIDTGVVSKGAAAYNILTGAIDAKGADAATVNKKVTIATNFTKAIDTEAEINAYNGAGAAAEARKLLTAVNANTDATAYQGTVNSVLANMVLGTTPGSTFSLTAQRDALVGTDANDTFVGTIFDNQNTLQGGDNIAGGGGNDTLRADIGNSQKFAFRAETTSVENIVLSAQTVSTDATDNNTTSTSEVQVDAERMNGVNRWEDNNSRADLLIEDVRILDQQITRDITIAMVSTDPGNVDFGVYFDQHSLRAAPVAASGATLRLQLMDTRSNDAGTAPLLNNPYNGFQFTFNGTAVRVASEAIDQAKTYADLLTAIKAAVANTPAISNFEVTLGTAFTAADTLSGRVQTGTEIVIKNPGAGTIVLDETSGWLANAPVPPSSGLHTAILTAPASTTAFKITSTVILDDVGRGSNGGDLVIGGLSTGDTSTSIGVERFEVTVERNSKLQTMNSTDNKLEEVVFINGAVNKGNVSIIGNQNRGANLGIDAYNPAALPNNGLPKIVQNPAGTPVGTLRDEALPGTDTINGGKQHGDMYGFHDIRLIDAQTMVGSLNMTAVITDRAVTKYITKVDTQANSAADNIAFSYTGGGNNDVMTVDLDAGVAGSRSHILSGLEDFTFALNGGAGNDQLTLRVVPAAAGSTAPTTNWQNNQDLNNNITISGGDGNDTIRKPGDGDTRIEGGAGDDTIYAENTGVLPGFMNAYGSADKVATNTTATWAFNTTNQTALNAYLEDRNIGNVRADTNETYNLYGTKVTVTYRGISSVVTLTDNVTYRTSDLQINQAIKNAINNNPVLNKLLLASDSASGALIVGSLTDGVHVAGDLTVGLTAPTAAVGALSASDLTAIATAYGLTADATGANVYAAMVTALATYTANGDYASAFATAYDSNQPAAVLREMVGKDGDAISDNIITGGTGNDVIVLGTREALNGGAQILAPTVADFAASDNDTLVYAPAFGNDTVLNFNAVGAGVDHLDFTALGGTTLTNAFTADKSITIGAPTATAAALTTTAIAALYNANNAAAQTHVYVAVDLDNIGTVYTIADAVGATNAVVTVAGTIDMADTAWGTLTQTNFVNSSAANYYLLEGASAFVAPVVVVPPTTAAVTLNNTVPGYNAGNNTNVTFTAAAQNFSSTLSNFAAGDKIVLPAGSVITVTDTVVGNNEVVVSATAGGFTQNITVQTQAPAVIGTAVNTVALFNTFFGANSLTIASSTVAVAVSSGNTNFDAATLDYAFNIATGTYTANVTNFAAGDVLNFVNGSVVTTNNAVLNDNIIDIVSVNGGTTTTIHLVGAGVDAGLAVGNAGTVAAYNAVIPGAIVIA
ncbi:DUF4214 domain-containing protein [Massilia atriviolacea]|uniref:DUF4214 domain-containing protein n=1 Tax=Massilia atriviolacea TaxID=2495579 RepID=A0A430HEP5_9BURK|nr:DUF4214 domain-containing protein [Massilia atriviolacea]RSZ55979.1 DUF4214 domain-containing protein [Massilia atriviolacea]